MRSATCTCSCRLSAMRSRLAESWPTSSAERCPRRCEKSPFWIAPASCAALRMGRAIARAESHSAITASSDMTTPAPTCCSMLRWLCASISALFGRLGQDDLLVDLEHHRPGFAGAAQVNRRQDDHHSVVIQPRKPFAFLDRIQSGPPRVRLYLLEMLADQVGIPALRHDQALIADDRHFTLALEQLCGNFLANTLDEVEVIVGTGHTEEAAIRDDWYRERRQPDLPALYDIWQRAEHALLEGFPRADVPAAFEHAVGVLVLGVVLHQWLDGDLAVCASRPVRREASLRCCRSARR